MLSGGLGNVITHVSLHSGDPGTTGTNELTGGSPAYARKTVGWAAAAAGQRASSSAQVFDVPAGTTVMYAGFWSALTAGTFYGYAPIGGTVVGFGTAKATGDVVTSHGHGLANGDRVLIRNVFAESVPTGLAEGTLYFVVGATTDTFQVSLTSGGAAVDITADGEVAFQKCIPEVFASQGTLTIGSGSLTLDATAIG
jgi:hypothetical protein